MKSATRRFVLLTPNPTYISTVVLQGSLLNIQHWCIIVVSLAIPLQLFSNYNTNCYTQDDKAFAGKPIRIREYETDLRGFMHELLGKNLSKQTMLDEGIGEVWTRTYDGVVRQAGDLNKDLHYVGSERAGLCMGRDNCTG